MDYPRMGIPITVNFNLFIYLLNLIGIAIVSSSWPRGLYQASYGPA